MATKTRCKHPEDSWLICADADPIIEGVEVVCTNCDREVTAELPDAEYNLALDRYLDAREAARDAWWERQVFEEDK